jgi:hypothetical protein
MRKTIAILLFVFGVTTAAAQTTPPAQGAGTEKKPVHMGVGRAITYPLRHPIRTQKGIAKAAKKTAQTIW